MLMLTFQNPLHAQAEALNSYPSASAVIFPGFFNGKIICKRQLMIGINNINVNNIVNGMHLVRF